MKLRIITSVLLVLFLSVLGGSQASAHEGCGKDKCCEAYYHGHHGCWGWRHYGYIYGPDGEYARHKECCEGKEGHKCADADHKSCCSHEYTYHRARYAEDCCGWGHLHYDCDKDHDKDSKED